MRCRKCGREVDSRRTFCPSCGIRLVAEPDMDELTNEIAGKVEFFMNEDENKKTGTSRTSYTDDKTITRPKSTDNDSVFDDISRSLSREEDSAYFTPVDISKKGYAADDDEIDLSDYEDDDEEESYSGPRKSSGKKKNNTGLIVGIIIAAVLVIGIIIACVFIFSKIGSKQEESSEETAEADIISCSVTEGAEYSSPLEITIESGLGYRMYYTLNGTAPTTSSAQYSGVITLDESYIDDTEGTQITLRVVSYTDNSIKSGEIEVNFTLVYGEVETPSITPSSGSYTQATMITITAESGAKIYYTTDGTTPTESSNLYTGSFSMERGNNVITAIAVKNGVSSSAATAVYDLEIPSIYTYTEAKDIALIYLMDRGDIVSEEGDTSDGGYVEFMDGGTCIIDEDQYIVVLCYFYDMDGNQTDLFILGVEDQEGTHIELKQTDSGYSK